MATDLTKSFLFAALVSILFAGRAAVAISADEDPTPEKALALQPRQKDVQCDRPAASDISKCTVQTEKRSHTVRDPGGLVLRKFADTNGDGVVDQFSFFKDGIEVYREIDSNFNKTFDQYRWLNTAGSRWGIDANEDGKIDTWKAISAEETTAELVAALRDRDKARFERLLLTTKELGSLGLGKAKRDVVAKKIDSAGAGFTALTNKKGVVASDTKWVSFGSTQPGLVPAGTDESTADLVVYENVAAMIETGGKPLAINVGTLVRVQDAWRLIDAPQTGDEATGDDSSHTTFFYPHRNEEAGQQASQGNKEVEGWIKIFQETKDSDHAKRTELLEKIAQLSDTPEMRSQMYKQLAETLMAAVQTAKYTPGIQKLKEIHEKLKADSKDDELAAFFQYRWLSAEHGQAISEAKDGTDFARIQTKWVEELEQFIKAARKYPDTADAMLELAISLEFAGEEDKALEWYHSTARDFPQSAAGRKAAGARLRLDSIGKPIQVTGKSVTDGKVFDLQKMKGKAVLIQYWASWSEPSKADLPLLRELVAKNKPNFEVVGVCLDSDKKQMQDFIKEYKPPGPQLYEEGGLDCRYANELGINTLPMMILVDKQGKVVNRNVRSAELDSELKKILK